METQSWTRRLTLGFSRRFIVFRDEGLEVIIMVGPEGRGVELELVLVLDGAGGRVCGGR